MFIAKKNINRDCGMTSSYENSKFNGELIDLSIGDIDKNTHSIVINSAFSDVLNGHTHYTHPKGAFELREKIAKYHFENFNNYIINPEDILVVSGGCHGMYLALQSILDELDEIIIFSPFFPVYKEQILLAGGTPIIVELNEKEKFQINKTSLEMAITPKTKGIIINTPSNPTGVCYTQESLNIIREFSIKYNLVVLADDIYDFYSYSSKFTPICTLPNMKDRTVTICSFSKNFAMTGWRIGYIHGPSDIINCSNNINESIVFSTSAPSQRAAIAALDNFNEIKNSLVPIFQERIDFFYDLVKNIDFLSCVKPQGGIYIFLNIEKTGLSSSEFAKLLFHQCGIKVLPGSIFGSNKHIRISLITNKESLLEVYTRMTKLKF